MSPAECLYSIAQIFNLIFFKCFFSTQSGVMGIKIADGKPPNTILTEQQFFFLLISYPDVKTG